MAEVNEAIKRQLEADKALADESRRQGDERLSKGKPTPTQEENDRAKLGEHVLEKEDDGSGPDPHVVAIEERHAAVQGRTMRPAPAGPGYQTRSHPAATPQPARDK
jgi:hypothetical protein